MKRGELYLVSKPKGDPKRQRVFVVVSHQGLIDSRFSTVVCAPILTTGEGLSTQVSVGPEDGLKHHSWIICDGLVSIPKPALANFVGTLSATKLKKLSYALAMALDLPIEAE
jgi:mRNA interferase MazF